MKTNKINILLFMLMSMIASDAFCQATSLVIENKTPGWLSSKIDYDDQQTVENLKITGYLNGTDITFIKNIKEQFSLQYLDLSESSIVKGGDSEYTTNDNEINLSKLCDYTKTTNLKPLKKLITLKTAKASGAIGKKLADTIIYCGTEEYISAHLTGDSKDTRTSSQYYKYLQFSENTKEISFQCGGYYPGIYKSGQTYYTGTLVFPSKIKKISGLYVDGGTIISYIEDPEDITSTDVDLKSGIIYVPVGTKQSYENSIFKKMNIIEMTPPTSIKFEQKNIKMFKSDSLSLNATIIPAETFYKELKWESTNENVVTTDQHGRIAAIKPGVAKVIASSEKDLTITDTCTVHVFEHATGIEFSQSQQEINIGETCVLNAYTLPLETSDNEMIWSSSDHSIATIYEPGKITALKLGTCIIKATSIDGGYTAECKVTVVQPASALLLNKHETTILVDNNERLIATISPDYTTHKEVTWASNNTEIAVVNVDGVVTAKKAGTAIITATAVSNTEAKDVCEVTVLQPATGIAIDETSWTVGEIGATKQLTAIVSPEDASNKSVEWTSSNVSVCSVSSTGIITSIGYGTAVIIATTKDGGHVATCIVTVYQPVTITAKNYSRAYGEENPVFEFTSTGGAVTGTPEITCEATKTSPVGTYPIVISKGTVTNLGDTYVNGTLTITPATLTISAGNYTKRQGEENPQFVASYEGFKNNETNEVLIKQPTISTIVTKATAPGEYPVTITGAEAQNYAISYINGLLKVLEADAIVIKADNKTITYGDDIPEFTYTVEGASLQGSPSITCEATSHSSVGTYPIIISKGSVTNYNDTYINGTLTIEKAPLTVSVGDYIRYVGEENPIFNLTYDGFRNGDNLSSLLTLPQAHTDATVASPEGTYEIVVSGGNAVNYLFKYENGTLTVIQTPTGINSVYESIGDGDAAIYSVSGAKQSTLHRGINIIKMSDGTTKKVIVK